MTDSLRKRRPSRRLLVIACLVASTATQLPAQEALASRVDALFAPWNRKDSAGAAVAVVVDGAVVYKMGYGMANLEDGVAITPDTVFHIASVSKQFTGFAVAALAEQDSLSLDDDVRVHLPEVPEFGEVITLRHLMHHTSGLRDTVELMLIAGFHDHDVADIQRCWSLVRGQRELNSPPGVAHLYSNTNYFLLSEVVARRSGQSFRSWLQEHAFGPLGMTRTHVHDNRVELIPGRARAYEMDGDGTFKENPVNSGAVGDSGIYSTAEDLGRWIVNMQTHAVGGEAVLRRMLETGHSNSGGPLAYAYGLVVDSHRGLRRVSHGGRSAGFLSQLSHYPDQRFGVVVLCNGYPMQPLLDPTALSQQIAELYLGEQMASAEAPAPAVPEFVELSARDLDRVAGWYWHTDRNYTRRIVRRGKRLVFRSTSGTEARLRPLGGDRFLMGGAPPSVVAFEPVGQPPRRMTVAVDGRDVDVFEPTDRPWRPSAEDLRGYAGVYYSPELRVAHSIVVRDGRLTVASMGRGESALRPVIRDHFNQGYPWWFGYDIHFERDAARQVRGLRVSNYHAKNIRFDKLGH